MPPTQYTAILSERLVLNPKFTQLKFELKEPPDFKYMAGQYISIQVSPEGQRRSYSLASVPKTHGFDLLITPVPDGLGSNYLTGLEPGAEISFLGPMGNFIMAADQKAQVEQSVVFVATGSGIAPCRSMVFDLLQNQKDSREITLYWGLRHIEDICLQEEFQELDQAFTNFHFHLVLSKAPNEWPLCRGRVTDCLLVHQRPESAGYYICGNPHMVEDIVKFLELQGVDQAFVHHEKFR